VLVTRLRDAIDKLNPTLTNEAKENALNPHVTFSLSNKNDLKLIRPYSLADYGLMDFMIDICAAEVRIQNSGVRMKKPPFQGTQHETGACRKSLSTRSGHPARHDKGDFRGCDLEPYNDLFVDVVRVKRIIYTGTKRNISRN
jgi:hypothetical protein